jgi:hypothetical protein
MTTPADAVPTTTNAHAAAALATAPATVGHISNLHKHLDEIEAWLGQRFKEVVALVEKAAPVVAEVGPAIAAAVPGVGSVVAAVEKAAGIAAHVAACCVHASTAPHTANGCTAKGCSCSATTSAPPIAAS